MYSMSANRKKSIRFVPSNQIKRHLMRHILEGRYLPGSTLPTIQELSETLKVSTKTVQKAIHALSAEGLIEAKRGVGLTVKAIPAQTGRKREIGLIHPNTPDYLKTDAYPGFVIKALQKALKKHDYTLVPWSLGSADPLTIVETIADRHWSGAVLLEIDSDPIILELRETRIPLVSMDYDASRHGISSVIFDNILGMFQATKLLIGLGHRNIALLRPLVRNPIINRTSLDWVEGIRLEGYRLAMIDAGLPIVAREFQNNPESCHAALLTLFACRPAPTACVCVADWSARHIATELMAMGFRIPEDVSITGLGATAGFPGAEFAPGRQLSSVCLEYAEMGAGAARLILEAIESPAHAARREVLPTRMEQKDSVAPLAATVA